MKVLLAEDDRVTRHALKCLLGDSGCDVAEACDGAAAIEMLQSDAPQVLLLDLVMPRVTGYDVLRWLRDEAPGTPPAVVILSGFIAESDEFEQYPCVIAVLQKPLITEHLAAVLETLREPVAA